ncbi:flagellar filament capping protein FliD [Aestuariibacter sp. AA17]|uniref:Flagellar hook-associated protein 2 n=1 Tax=Fluctibacter corallii TaxID=2984329 RepID=A0ABT3A9V4_9ALTE|nr:flagellar filament capping protein FliD [Aestuariibacter sp. AA17]MCV2885468.1 flagellar filament capping protein FliD [Aestuariibacter sp. AA17]
MTIQSLGVGSGLALDDLVNQLIEAERKPKQDRLDNKEKSLDATISGIGKLKSKMSDFLKSVDDLRSDFNLKGREPKVTNPSESVTPFTAEASNSALEGDYKVAVTQLASGSRIETADAASGGYANSNSSVLSAGSGSLTFKIGSTGDSFSVNVTAGMSLTDLRNEINKASGNFGVNANIIDTGTATGGAKLVFSSSVTGAGNDLQIVNDNDIAELQKVATTDSTETATYLTPIKSAQNAQATIDGILVESQTNKFNNTIQNVSFEATELSPKDATNNFQASTLSIGYDKEGVEKKIRDFVENFNALNKEIKTLTKYGESELEEDGALAGDFMVRSIQTGLANIVSSSVESSALGGLFQIGIQFNDDGDLEIGTTSEFGLKSGEDRLKDALDNNFDEIANLFSNTDDGVARNLYDYVKEYTTFSGLLSSRERSVKDEKDQLSTEREQFELRMLSYEQILRGKYLNLDQTVARLNQTGNALMAALGGL